MINTKLNDLTKLTSDHLLIALSALHYVLYERFDHTIEEEKEWFDDIHAELKKRGHDIQWSGFTG